MDSSCSICNCCRLEFDCAYTCLCQRLQTGLELLLCVVGVDLPSLVSDIVLALKIPLKSTFNFRNVFNSHKIIDFVVHVMVFKRHCM